LKLEGSFKPGEITLFRRGKVGQIGSFILFAKSTAKDSVYIAGIRAWVSSEGEVKGNDFLGGSSGGLLLIGVYADILACVAEGPDGIMAFGVSVDGIGIINNGNNTSKFPWDTFKDENIIIGSDQEFGKDGRIFIHTVNLIDGSGAMIFTKHPSDKPDPYIDQCQESCMILSSSILSAQKCLSCSPKSKKPIIDPAVSKCVHFCSLIFNN